MLTRGHSGSSRSISRRVRYLTFSDLNKIAYELAEDLFHEWLGPMPVLTVLGGESGVGVLEGILALPKQTAGRKPAYPTVFDKAAVLLRSMILDHPFVDGNKRMAIASSLVFLYMNGYIVSATDHELVRLAIRVAVMGRSTDWSHLSAWFGRRSLSIDEIEDALLTGTADDLTARLPGRASLRRRPLLKLVISGFLAD